MCVYMHFRTKYAFIYIGCYLSFGMHRFMEDFDSTMYTKRVYFMYQWAVSFGTNVFIDSIA